MDMCCSCSCSMSLYFPLVIPFWLQASGIAIPHSFQGVALHTAGLATSHSVQVGFSGLRVWHCLRLHLLFEGLTMMTMMMVMDFRRLFARGKLYLHAAAVREQMVQYPCRCSLTRCYSVLHCKPASQLRHSWAAAWRSWNHCNRQWNFTSSNRESQRSTCCDIP